MPCYAQISLKNRIGAAALTWVGEAWAGGWTGAWMGAWGGGAGSTVVISLLISSGSVEIPSNLSAEIRCPHWSAEIPVLITGSRLGGKARWMGLISHSHLGEKAKGNGVDFTLTQWFGGNWIPLVSGRWGTWGFVKKGIKEGINWRAAGLDYLRHAVSKAHWIKEETKGPAS